MSFFFGPPCFVVQQTLAEIDQSCQQGVVPVNSCIQLRTHRFQLSHCVSASSDATLWLLQYFPTTVEEAQ